MAALPKYNEDLDGIYNVPKNIFPNKLTEIQKFYSNKNVFITGATGFLGKLLLEKLLWSCPDIKTIYLLMRSKKGKDCEARIEELFNTQAFMRLKRDRPLFKEKLKVIRGDITLPCLGISESDREKLISEIDIVFHVAASVRFQEPLKDAINVNLKAVQQLVDIAKNMHSLKAFVHVSTAYSHCYLKTIEECFYDSPINDPVKLLNFVESVDKKLADDLTPKLLGKWPNTYTFTKAMAENHIKQSASDLPTGIFRPSIVISSFNEPVPRWVDNLYGVNGFVLACSIGLLRAIKLKHDCNTNLVPVDMCVNGLISVAWDIAEHYKELRKSDKKFTSTDIKIYNYTLTTNPITWEEFYDLTCKGGDDYPPSGAIWYRTIFMSDSYFLNYVQKIFLHYIPAVFFDFLSVCSGRPKEILSTYKRIHKADDAIDFFKSTQWTFSNDNMLKVITKMSEDDRKLYPCDLRNIKWKDFLTGYYLGIRRYLIKDDDSTIPAAKRKYRMLYCLNMLMKIFLYLITFRGMYAILKLITNKYMKKLQMQAIRFQ